MPNDSSNVQKRDSSEDGSSAENDMVPVVSDIAAEATMLQLLVE